VGLEKFENGCAVTTTLDYNHFYTFAFTIVKSYHDKVVYFALGDASALYGLDQLGNQVWKVGDGLKTQSH
jgi:hypothetical protein